MKRIVIAGAGDLGREVRSWLSTIPATQRDWEFRGFIDDNKDGVLASIKDFSPGSDDWIIPAIANPKAKLDAMKILSDRGVNFFTLIHPTAVLGTDVKIGKGCVLCPHVVVSCSALVHDFVTINISATIGHDTEIGEGSIVSCHADVMGHVKLGTGVFLGSHAAILPGMQVGNFAVVGAGSVVMRKVPPNVTVVGNPAKRFIGLPEESE